MDTELFMECEEEELEPWQQVDDSVEEDEMDFFDNYCEPVEDSLSPLPVSETPPTRTSSITPSSTASSPAQIFSSSVIPPRPPSSSTAAVTTTSLVAHAPSLFLTQTAGGTFLLPAAPGNTAPILLTTQGFPVQTMMKPGTPLLLNLQPGQTVQPLTLIQSPSLGQLVQPSVGVSSVLSQARSAPVPLLRPAQPSSGYTTMRLPTTLTIHTSSPGPVNFQIPQVGGAKAMTLAACPVLPSGSANRVSRETHAPGPNTSKGSALSSDPTKVVMSVEEFYYGTFEGDLSLRKPHPLGIKTSTFTCQICSHLAMNNLRLMQHMLQHSQLVTAGSSKDTKCCCFCFRQFSSPAQLFSHQEQVHGSSPSSCMCRICEWAFENEPAFLNHMKANHKPGEMPYVCQVCSYRSSFYSELLQHFASFHGNSRFLLCLFCLKVNRNPATYQQHVLRHQVNLAFHCNRCRLQFIFLKDKMQHKLENHRSFRRPAKLEGLLPGSKVTIRTYGKLRFPMTRLLQNPSSFIKLINIKTEQQSPNQRTPMLSKPLLSPPKRPASHRVRSSSHDSVRLVCLECGTDAADFAAHYPTHVHCLLCPYSSCCSRAYAAHMIRHHVSRSKDKVLPLHELPPPCAFLLCCSGCDFRPLSADHMANHLLMTPEHYSATCRTRTYVEPDIRFCNDEEQRSTEEKEPVQNEKLPDPSWRSADCWKPPSESKDSESSIVPFMQTSGPRNSLSRNGDAIDFFNLLFPAELVQLITNETNAHAKTCRYLDSSYSDWVPVTAHEVKGFIGLCVLMGIQNLPDPSHYWSWNHYDNSYTFYRAMSFKRFKQIASNIRMGSFTTDDYRRTSNPKDSLHIFRPMLDLLGGAMWSAYGPNCCLTIDRALLPSLEGESSLAKGNRRIQPQVWLLCDSKSGYCHRFFIQVGEQVGHDQGFTVVPGLVKDLEDKHHQLYLASSLTSVPLMQKLLDQDIYASSSFPPPNPILPRELWVEGKLEKSGDFQQRQFGPLLATRWRDTKEMCCLSTNAAPGEPDTVWRRSQTKVGGLDPIDRPMAYRLLQENMRGVDICKQLLACNPLGGILLDRHWRSLFWFLVNLSIVNAFIVLRETRKDNPPAWVQDGLFTQINFRKRLGNQLAKCAQKFFENMEVASSRGTKEEGAPEPVKQRHRMSKLSSISKRCKNCSLKNIRHESVYGCIACMANLCKHPGCFWEFHGLSPLDKGSTKVGFIQDTVSGVIEVDNVRDNVDGALAPVEDFDFSDDDRLDELDEMEDETEDIKEESNEEVKYHTSPPPSTKKRQSAAVSSASKEREDFLSARQLRITLLALCDGLHQASQVFATDLQLIRSWLKEARKHLKQTEQEQKVLADGEERMVAWVLSMREQQLPISESSLFHKASTLKKKGHFSDSFRISYDWAVSFMLQHRLGVRTVGRTTLSPCSLPPSMDAKIRSFRTFTHRVIQVHKLAKGSVAAMDELCLFVDLRVFQDKSRRADALELTGSVPLVTVYLTALADGTMLSSLVLAKRQLAGKVLPDFIVLESGRETLPVEEALDLWTKKIWLKHTAGQTQPSKSLLVLDRHREHMGDSFITSLSGSGTLPAMIPAGCSSHLQPLEVCVKPVLQRFLLSRWETFSASDPKELEETSPHRLQAIVTHLLVDWLVDALTHLKDLLQLWRMSFHLTGILPGCKQDQVEKEEMQVDNKTENQVEKVQGQNLEQIQSDLLRTLTETLLGSEAGDEDAHNLLELDDEENMVEEEEPGEGQDTSEKQGGKEDRMEINKGGEEGRQEDEEEKGQETVKEKEEGNEGKEEVKKQEEDSEEEGKDKKEVSKERRETRIVIGEEVGDEWKITVKSRTDGIEADGENDGRVES